MSLGLIERIPKKTNTNKQQITNNQQEINIFYLNIFFPNVSTFTPNVNQNVIMTLTIIPDTYPVMLTLSVRVLV